MAKKKGIVLIKELPVLFQKLFMKNLEKLDISIYSRMYEYKYNDVKDMINSISWSGTAEGSVFWARVYNGKYKEAFNLYKKKKNGQSKDNNSVVSDLVNTYLTTPCTTTISTGSTASIMSISEMYFSPTVIG